MKRQSSLESLRLVAALAIIFFHLSLVNPSAEWLQGQPLSWNKFFFQFICLNGGWIGNFLFFAITAWFLAERTQNLHDNLRRIYMMERTVLFWSVALLLIAIIVQCLTGEHLVGIIVILRSIMPLCTSWWWYPTSYALFLLFLPFLIRGLQSLGKRLHGFLTMLCLLLWGIGGIVPIFDNFNLNASSVFMMIYWFIAISYYRWYCKEFTNKQCIYMIGAGLLIQLFYWLSGNFLFMLTGKGANFQTYIFDGGKIPSLLIAAGIFLICEKFTWKNEAVNWIAKSAFGVYLISAQPLVWDYLNFWFDLKKIFLTRYPIFSFIAGIFFVFVLCLVFDMIRRGLFALTIDKTRGCEFEWCYKRIVCMYRKITTRVNGKKDASASIEG